MAPAMPPCPPGSPCCRHCPDAGQPPCRTVAGAPAGPCTLRDGGGGDIRMGPVASTPPPTPTPELLPRRMPRPPCSSCARCHWLRCMMSWYCCATSGGTGRRACLRARIWGWGRGCRGSCEQPADAPVCPTEPRRAVLTFRSRRSWSKASTLRLWRGRADLWGW